MRALAPRIYRAALRLFPASFRTEYGEETAAVFETSYRLARERLGSFRLFLHTVRACGDLAIRLPREWLDHWQRPISNARPPAATRSVSMSGDQFWLDVRLAARSIRKNPTFAAVVTGTLALGIGANAAIFSVLDGVLLRPLPYPDADGLVTIAEVNPSIDIEPRWASMPNYVDWKEETSSFSSMALYRGRSMSITEDGDPLYAYGTFVTDEFLETLGVSPLLGRGIRADEVGPIPASVVLISHGLWTSRYAGDSALVGRTIQVDGVPHTVIGIMPPGFDAPSDWIGSSLPVNLWRPFPFDPANETRLNRSYHVVGRLVPGVTIEEARADIAVVAARLRDAHADANRDWQVRVITWQDIIVGDVRPALHLLAAMVGFILLIACANVANLMLNRMLTRRTDLAVRAALGAGRWRLMRHTFVESLMLAVLGGIAGVAIAVGLVHLVTMIDAGTIPLAHRVAVNPRVVIATLGLSLMTGVVFGLVPAVYGARTNLVAAFATGTTRVAGGRHPLRDTLVVSQLVLAFSLLVGAGLVLRSFRQLINVEPGFSPDGVVAATVALSWDRVDSLSARAMFVREVIENLRTIPGVSEAAMVNSLPFSGSNSWQAVWREGEPLGDPSRQPAMAFRGVSPEYFATMGIPLIRGRAFDERDVERPVTAIVSQAGARYLWPNEDALGQRIGIRGGSDTLTVVGIVGDVRHFGLDAEPRPELYQPYSDEYLTSKSFVVRAAGPTARIADDIRAVFRRVDPDQPIREIRTMRGWIDQSIAQPRFNAVIMSLGSFLALVLAAVGLFAVISYTVTERRREIGVRLALGAPEKRITRSIVQRGVTLAAIGVVGGVALALGVTQVLQTFLFGVSAHDPATYGSLAAGFLVIAALASYLPARRASRTDPVETLRES